MTAAGGVGTPYGHSGCLDYTDLDDDDFPSLRCPKSPNPSLKLFLCGLLLLDRTRKRRRPNECHQLSPSEDPWLTTDQTVLLLLVLATIGVGGGGGGW